MKHLVDGKMYTIPNAPALSLEEKIKRLEDTESIKECMSYYFYYADMMDPVGMASCFTDDARLCWSPGGEVYYGKEAILADFKSRVGAPNAQVHHGSNKQILFRTPDDAMMLCYLYSWKRFPGEKPDYIIYARYEINAVRDTDGEWRFASMQFLTSGEANQPTEAQYFDRPWPPAPIHKK